MTQSLAIIRQSYRPDGGAERIIQRMLTGLQQYHPLDITLITERWQGSEESFKVLKVARRGWTRAARFEHFIANTQALLTQHTFDWVQAHERVPGCQIYRAGDGVHAEWLRIRGEYLGRVGQWWQQRDRFHQAVLKSERELFHHANLQAVICNSEQVRQEILQHYPKMDAAKLHLVRNGIDLGYFSPPSATERLEARRSLGLKAKMPTLLFVGSGFERKGLPLLLQALIRSPYWHLLVVGQDKHSKNYQKICLQWGVSHRVKFLGMMKDVRPAYQAADVLVHPAWYDPAPNVILEAMAMGLPVITSQHCGNKELIEPDVNGFVVPIKPIQPLLTALNTKTDWAMLGQAARKTVEQYPIERMINELTAVYQQVMAEKVMSVL
ncbi:glycosyltransferase family 4 protein [Thiofilum flexile]|uniref:glycosyltransferase family 4 protein n=1 Tax=Thiofilum flexile TaxID=125627 RepID=UPI000381A473|nr:glycosyltransferase family 4 protein [Thiofilum flexile]